MIAYDKAFDPPAIVLPVIITGAIHDRPRIEIPALIDTGADISALPDTLVDRLRLYPLGRLQLEDANAVKTLVFTYEAHLAPAGESVKRMEVVLTPYPFAILGRDWLRDYHLFLDGPGQQFLLSRDRFVIQES